MRCLTSASASIALLLAAPALHAGAGGSSSPGPWVGAGGRPRVDRHLLIRVEPGVRLSEGEDALGRITTGNPELDALNDTFHVNAVWRVHQDPPNGRRDPALFHALGLNRIYYLQFVQGRNDLDEVARRYEGLASVERAWTDRIVGHCQVPNDTKYPAQWNFSWEDLDCEPAWDVETDSNVLISVIDSGGELKHADLDDNLWVNPGETAGNNKDDDGNGYIDDVHGFDFWNADGSPNDDFGHGSHVAGIIGAEGNNGRDVAGVCWSATMQMVKVLDSTGAGTWTSISQGIVYAADNGAVVSNYSVGGTSYDLNVDTSTQYAAGLDIVQVAAAGNLASNSAFYPAAYADVIAVMASDIAEKRARWSNYGSWCDLCAPGDGITSLWQSGGTAVLTGTSQSAPHVSAIAALVRTLNPQLDRIDTELLIKHTAKDLGAPGRDSSYEWGLADLHRALDAAASLTLSTTSSSVGGRVDLHVNRPDSRNDFYVLLPSVSERVPGYWLGTVFSGEERYVPINWDAVTDLSLLLPTVGVWNSFAGFLDANGTATATLVIPGGRLLLHKPSYFSGIILPFNNLSTVTWVLNSVTLDVQ